MGRTKQRTLSEEHKRKIGLASKGRKHSEETKRKMSEVHKGKHPSEETRMKLSKSHIGNKSHLGHEHSKEAKQKMSESHKGSKNVNWKGGQYIDSAGRIMILMPEHPRRSQNSGYVLRSRLIMEKTLGRYLKPCEVVHHINAIVDDDRPENLQLFPNTGIHTKFHNKLKRQ